MKKNLKQLEENRLVKLIAGDGRRNKGSSRLFIYQRTRTNLFACHKMILSINPMLASAAIYRPIQSEMSLAWVIRITFMKSPKPPRLSGMKSLFLHNTKPIKIPGLRPVIPPCLSARVIVILLCSFIYLWLIVFL